MWNVARWVCGLGCGRHAEAGGVSKVSLPSLSPGWGQEGWGWGGCLWVECGNLCRTPRGRWFCRFTDLPTGGWSRVHEALRPHLPTGVRELSTGRKVVMHNDTLATSSWGDGVPLPQGVVSCFARRPCPPANYIRVLTPLESRQGAPRSGVRNHIDHPSRPEPGSD